MKNEKLTELDKQLSQEEQLAILDEISAGLKENTESLRKMLAELKEEFGE